MHAESETFCQQHHFLSVPKWISMDELLRILLRFIYHGAAAAFAAAVAVITTIEHKKMARKNKYTLNRSHKQSEREKRRKIKYEEFLPLFVQLYLKNSL